MGFITMTEKPQLFWIFFQASNKQIHEKVESYTPGTWPDACYTPDSGHRPQTPHNEAGHSTAAL